MHLRRFVPLVLVFTLACSGAAKKAPIFVANSAVATADIIGQLNNAGRSLQQASVITPDVNLHFQQLLLTANDKLKPLPDILRAIDNLQKVGQPAASETERAIAILTAIGQDISVVVQGVPLSDATKALIDLIRTAQQTIDTVLVEVAKIRGRA